MNIYICLIFVSTKLFLSFYENNHVRIRTKEGYNLCIIQVKFNFKTYVSASLDHLQSYHYGCSVEILNVISFLLLPLSISVTPRYVNDVTCSSFFPFTCIFKLVLLHLFGIGSLTKITIFMTYFYSIFRCTIC